MRKIAQIASGAAAAALVSTVGLAPAASAAAADISGTVCTCGDWTKYSNVRTKDGNGDIVLRLTNNTSTVTVIRLHNANNGDAVFTDPRTFTDEPQTKTIANNVLAQTRFKMGARMYANRFSDNFWAGRLTW